MNYMQQGLRSALGVTEWKLVMVISSAIKLITQGAGISVKGLIFQSATGSVYFDNCKWREQHWKMYFVSETKGTKQTEGEAAYLYDVGTQY